MIPARERQTMKLKKTTPAGITGHYYTTINGTLYEIQRCDKGTELDDGHHIVGFWYVTDFGDFAYEARTLTEAKEDLQIHVAIDRRRP
jgi:hypothetical protein